MFKLKVLLRVDANSKVGLAHAVRLKKLMSNVPFSFDLSIFGSDERVLESFFPEARFLKVDNLKCSTDFHFVVSDCIVRNDIFWREWLPKRRPILIVIDDYGGDLPADLILNGTVIDSNHKYTGTKKGCQILCGPEYALIDTSYSKNLWSKNYDLGNHLIVVIGSGERAAQWAFKIVKDLQLNNLFQTINIIVGSAFKEFEALKLLASKKDIKAEMSVTSDYLASLLSECSISLITGGMILYEALAVGIPTIVFPQEQNLIEEANWFERQDCVVNLGYNGGMDMHLVACELESLIVNEVKLDKMSRNSISIIDGRGMKRAASAIEAFIKEKLDFGA